MSIAPIPQEFINELLARVDIVQLIDARVPLRKKGKNYIACCPFHSEKTPSFTVTPEKQFYYCFGCAISGNAFNFLMDYEKLSFLEAVSILAESLGMEIPHAAKQQEVYKDSANLYTLLEEVAQFYANERQQNKTVRYYLKQRNLSDEIMTQFRLGYAPLGWDTLLKAFKKETERLLTVGLLIKKSKGQGYYDRFRDRVLFPIRDRKGRVIGFGGRTVTQGEPKYLNSPETLLFHKGKELYGLYEVFQHNRHVERILVVEGYMDVLALFQAGFPFAVATLGTAMSRDQLSRLMSHTQEIIFCFDGDSAGKKAAWRVLEQSLALLTDGYIFRFLCLPHGEDPDSFIQKKGADEFMTFMEQAQSLTEFLFSGLLAQVDITQLEGKARLAKLAVPLIEKVTQGIMQYKLFEQLARLVNIDVMTLKKITTHTTNHPLKTMQKKINPVSKVNRFSPMRLAIALLIQFPHIAQSLSDKQCQILNTLKLPGSDLLVQLFSVIKQQPELTSAMLLEYWRDDEVHYKILKQLMGYSITIPKSGVQAEFDDLLKFLKKSVIENQIDNLLQQGKQTGLNVQEKKQLYHLMLTTLHER
ncbi:DNA primase [Rickettsiella grylli]|uniref:DNA primase n=1 Tax=Rickettsiella grylli TaxID=59196 RepID=A8PNJ9_9COXI|nr:DNA primase [Rickettsiella grylli]EDP45763.1 DNA primase [Rickettsiella grylli]